MPLRDLFRACPICGRASGLRPDGKHERCLACQTRFRRGAGANIRAALANGEVVDTPPVEWFERLATVTANPDRPIVVGPERVRLRIAESKEPIRRRGELIGWIERFGPPRFGTFRLDTAGLHFRGEGELFTADWPLSELTAVQPSSTSLQIKARERPVAAVRFMEGSLRYWEDCIQLALRDLYHAEGRGEILEFQPHIMCR